jgi:hypothetical protein
LSLEDAKIQPKKGKEEQKSELLTKFKEKINVKPSLSPGIIL